MPAGKTAPNDVRPFSKRSTEWQFDMFTYKFFRFFRHKWLYIMLYASEDAI